MKVEREVIKHYYNKEMPHYLYSVKINLCKYAKFTLKTSIFLCGFCVILCNVKAQQKSDVGGYVSLIPSLIYQHPADETWWQLLVHNRLNFGWQLADDWRIDVGVRNRFVVGSRAMIDPASMAADNGWADLSWNYFGMETECTTSLLNTAFDRFFLTFERDKWKLQLGRQRINWGQTFVWNPNDIFNTYSFFDFDYPERPGGDAFRGTYYHSETASSELAISVNRDGRITAAVQHLWNYKNTDYQLIAGEVTESDIVLGGAITSDFKGLNFRSEFSFFQPFRSNSNWKLPVSPTLSVSAGLDYTFSNSLTLQAEMLYNNADKSASGNGLMRLYAAPVSAKNLSVCDWNIFTQASCPLTPRLNIALSGMFFVDIKAYYAGLSLDCSIIENLDFSFIAQTFAMTGNSALGNTKFALGFARLKYSF
jgi:hypothetical protein